MRRVAALYRSSVGKKVLMAVTGFVWFGFLIGHMAGNLKAYLGAEHFNEYAHYLRVLGEPLLPERSFLWAFRIVLLLAFVTHVVLALQTTAQSRAARPRGYKREKDLSLSASSRWMRIGGIAILAFVVFHILHMTTGTLHPSFVEGDAYGNLVRGLSSPLIAAIYLVGMVAVAAHLFHGVWSMLQTLGLDHPKYRSWRRPFAVAMAVVVFLGFVSVPVSILTGLLGGS